VALFFPKKNFARTATTPKWQQHPVTSNKPPLEMLKQCRTSLVKSASEKFPRMRKRLYFVQIADDATAETQPHAEKRGIFQRMINSFL